MSELTFIDELPEAPPRVGGSASTVARAAELRAHPGRWARWPTKTSPNQVKVSLKKHVGEGFEVVGRKVDGKVRAFARYVGQSQDAARPPPSSSAAPSDAGTTPCPICSEKLHVDAPFGQTEKARALSKHRIRSGPCDSALKRRTKPR